MPKARIPIPRQGIVNDPRDPREGVSRMVAGFDILTNPYKATPHGDSEDGDSSSSTSQKQNFVVAKDNGGNYDLYALGVVSGTGRAEVLFKNISTGASNDLDDATWGSTANNSSSTGSTEFNVFVYYAQSGLVYGTRAGRYIWSYDPTGGGWTDSARDLTSYTNTAQGLVHSKDDILYIPYDNKIASYDEATTTWDNNAVGGTGLPSHLYITSICEYGNYLAIACAPLSGVGQSVVYLWDRDASLTTLSESINWGDGKLMVLETVNGHLVGITQKTGNQFIDDMIVFRRWNGGQPKKILELVDESSGQLPLAKQIANNRLYFMLHITLNGTLRKGVWSIGQPTPNSEFAVSLEYFPDNDTAIDNGSLSLKNFFILGDYAFISHLDSGSAYALSKTKVSASAFVYSSTTAVIETTINSKMKAEDKGKKKQLLGVRGLYELLTSGEQVVVDHKVDGGAYSEIFTESTASVIATEGIKDSSGDSFATGYDYEFRIKSTGGAEITGLEYKYDIIETQI